MVVTLPKSIGLVVGLIITRIISSDVLWKESGFVDLVQLEVEGIEAVLPGALVSRDFWTGLRIRDDVNDRFDSEGFGNSVMPVFLHNRFALSDNGIVEFI